MINKIVYIVFEKMLFKKEIITKLINKKKITSKSVIQMLTYDFLTNLTTLADNNDD